MGRHGRRTEIGRAKTVISAQFIGPGTCSSPHPSSLLCAPFPVWVRVCLHRYMRRTRLKKPHVYIYFEPFSHQINVDWSSVAVAVKNVKIMLPAKQSRREISNSIVCFFFCPPLLSGRVSWERRRTRVGRAAWRRSDRKWIPGNEHTHWLIGVSVMHQFAYSRLYGVRTECCCQRQFIPTRTSDDGKKIAE